MVQNSKQILVYCQTENQTSSHLILPVTLYELGEHFEVRKA